LLRGWAGGGLSECGGGAEEEQGEAGEQVFHKSDSTCRDESIICS
jgi:hypothetical protein